jgi:predicted nucleic acid-binding protein
MIFDTDVLIWIQRGYNAAAELMNQERTKRVSIVSYMEFIQLTQNKKQLQSSRHFFNSFCFDVLPITPDISHRAATYIEQYSLSHGLRISDALIAATAYECGLPLATSNVKDYKMIDGLELKQLRV